jgi:hypothetical protein
MRRFHLCVAFIAITISTMYQQCFLEPFFIIK